jgi:hypothetical protein
MLIQIGPNIFICAIISILFHFDVYMALYFHRILLMMSVAVPGIFFRVFITKLEYNFFFLIIIIHEFCSIKEFGLLL